jgi:FlaA1/EpsC-like NDP-sugar epimerase
MSILIKQAVRGAIVMFLDAWLILLAFMLAYMIRFDLSVHLIATSFLPEFAQSMPKLAVSSIVIKLICFRWFGLYRIIWKQAGMGELKQVAQASLVGNVLMLGLVFVTRTPVPRSIFIITFFLDAFFVMGVRMAYWWARRRLKGMPPPPPDARRVLIVGCGEEAAAVIDEMRRHQERNYLPIAVVDEQESLLKKKVQGVPVLGGPRRIPYLVQIHGIHVILILPHDLTRAKLGELFDDCVPANCPIQVLEGAENRQTGNRPRPDDILRDIRDIRMEDLPADSVCRLTLEMEAINRGGEIVLLDMGKPVKLEDLSRFFAIKSAVLKEKTERSNES